MMRQQSHFEDNEPFLENLLCFLRFRKIFRHIPKNSRILDLGCGYNGKFLQKIRENISSGVGVDISVNYNISDSKIKLIAHDLNEKLPFPENEFDVVISLAILEHLLNPELSLEEIHRVLKPGGILLLTTPSIYSKPILEFFSFKLGLISEKEIRDHKHYASRDILRRYCENIGFSSFRHKYFQFRMNNFVMAQK